MTLESIAKSLVAEARERGLSLTTAESLTGGLVSAAIVAVAGASNVFRGGVVSYATELKRELLGVDAELLLERGAVDADVAAQMAERVRIVAGGEQPADLGIATTGVAGPDQQDGHAVGEVFVAVATATATRVEHFQFTGDRANIRSQATASALELALEIVRES